MKQEDFFIYKIHYQVFSFLYTHQRYFDYKHQSIINWTTCVSYSLDPFMCVLFLFFLQRNCWIIIGNNS